MTAAAAAAAAAPKEGEKDQAFSTCSKVLYNNARCGQPVVSPAVDYCTHHRPDRIPCPVDPRHFVSAKSLQKHLKKCNATKRAAALAACPFFQEGVNRGRGVPTALERAAREEAAKDLSGTKRPRLAPGRKRAAEAMGHERLLELLARVRRAAYEVLPLLGAAVGGATPAEAETQAATTTTTKPSAAASSAPRPFSLKHDSQNDGIVAIALEAGVFGFSRSRRARTEEPSGGSSSLSSSSSASASVAVVELGAGRGYLGAAAADALVRLHGGGEERDGEEAREEDDGGEEKKKNKGGGGDEASVLPLRCSSLTLVDRRAYRNKAERHYRSVVGSGSGGKVQAAAAAAGAQPEKKKRQRPPFELCRATVDLADTLLASLPGVAAAAGPPSSSGAVAPVPRKMIALLGKHLCGPATDFALRAAVTQLRLSPPPEEEGEEEGEEGDGGKKEDDKKKTFFFISGLAIASCCHHSCCWSDFAGKAEFLALGFTADEFEVVSQASAWATGGHGRVGKIEKREGKSGSDEEDQEEEDDGDDVGDDEELKGPQKGCWQSRIPIDLRRASGDAAKRLLDGCRVRWLERRSSPPSRLAVVARPYAPEGVTGENRLIVAVPRRRRGD